ncbi:DUF2786 domain-containing protein [Streptomyces sp. DT117]|uniref:DUF2786 domain-containing protein n=1 Tax=Streptomyces sp. DT117 TaxID=3393422 RepID=UPI003CE9B938
MSVNESTLAKIRAILAKAEDPAATPEEAETYFSKAASLMSKYGVERAMLAEADPSTDKPSTRIITVKGSYLLDRVQLLNNITQALGGQTVRWRVFDRETGKNAHRVELHAYESTLDRVEILFTSLLLQAFNGMRQSRPAWGESTTAYRKSWLAGFSQSVYQRLTDAEEIAAAQATKELGGRSAELVLASREDTIRVQFKAAYPKLRMAPKRRLTGSGWSEGKAAGQRADLGGTRVSSGRRRAVSA